ncbi:MAG: OmpA family protein [Pseudorhodobacter sp.]
MLATPMAAPAAALTPILPETAVETGVAVDSFASYALPMGAWRDGAVPNLPLEGRIIRRAWKIDGATAGTLALLAPLRDQLRADGFTLAFECATAACGGFDFRFATEVLPEPDMHVDLGDFRFVAATRGDGEAVTLLVSRSARAGHVQMIHVDPATSLQDRASLPVPDLTEASQTSVATTLSTAGRIDQPLTLQPSGVAANMGTLLEAGGSIVLDGLEFPSGEARLLENAYPVLASLATWMKADPDRRITLVGHTDASGGLETNISLSRRRAEAVRQRLIERHAIEPARIEAQGVGYLAPRDSNRTEEGRTRNRRVEAIVTSTR